MKYKKDSQSAKIRKQLQKLCDDRRMEIMHIYTDKMAGKPNRRTLTFSLGHKFRGNIPSQWMFVSRGLFTARREFIVSRFPDKFIKEYNLRVAPSGRLKIDIDWIDEVQDACQYPNKF